MLENISEEVKSWVLKVLIWPILAISVQLAVKSKKEKLTYGIVFAAFITGISSAWLFSEYVSMNFAHQYQPLIIAVIAISGEKIGEYILYTINFKKLFDALMAIFNSK